MKTQVLMKRKLFDSYVKQQSDTGFLSANELVKAGNKWRINNDLPVINLQEWLRSKKTIEFINELESQTNLKAKKAGRGRSATTWLHPFLFIDLALYISPKLKIEVYSWLYDELLKYRNVSGDSYKKMTGALYYNCKNKSSFTKEVMDVANKIKLSCGVTNWEEAEEHQLKQRDKIHENIALLCDVLRNNDDAVRIAILKAQENL